MTITKLNIEPINFILTRIRFGHLLNQILICYHN